MTLKTAVFAPMPSASMSTATDVKPGFLSNWRKANLRSFMIIVPSAADGMHGPNGCQAWQDHSLLPLHEPSSNSCVCEAKWPSSESQISNARKMVGYRILSES